MPEPDQPRSATDGPPPQPSEALGFWHHAKAYPDVAAVVIGERHYRYGDLLARVNRLSNALRARGLTPGSVLAVLMGDGIEFFEVLLATAQIGVDVLTMSVRSNAAEIAHLLSDSGALGLVVDADLLDVVSPAADRIDPARLVVRDPDGKADYEKLVGEGDPDAPTERIAGYALMYTSGTTGPPKCVRRPRGEALTPEQAYLPRAAGNVERFGWRVGAEVFLLCGPLYLRAPSTYGMLTLMLGGTVVVAGDWRPETALQLIERHGVTSSHLFPTMLHQLLGLPPTTREHYDVSSLRSVVHAGSPCPVRDKYDLIAWWGPVLAEYYASTEGGGTVVTATEWLSHPGTVGRAWRGAEVQIRDESGTDVLPHGTVGTIWFSLAQDFEYANNPVATAASVRDGWFTAADLGRLDAQGWLYVVARRADVITSAGMTVYPFEVEHVLLGHPSVDEVAVVGLPDPLLGQAVLAVVTLRRGFRAEGAEDLDVIATELREHSSTMLPEVARPQHYSFVATLPRTESGKVLRTSLTRTT